MALDLIGFGIILPVLPRFAEDSGASPTTAGFLVASFSIAQLLCSPLWGRVSDRIGRKPVLIVSLVGTAIGSLLTGLAGSVLLLLFIGRIVDGASGASVSVAQAAVADIAAPEDRPRLLGLLGAAFGAGFALGPAIGGLAALVDHRLPFFVAAAIAAVNALAAIRRLPETHPDRSGVNQFASANSVTPERDVPAQEVAARGQLLQLVLVMFIAVVAFSAFEATFSLLTKARFELSESGTYGVFFVIGIALVVVQGALIHPVTSLLRETKTIRVGLAANALGLVLVALDSGWVTLAPGLLFLVMGQGLLAPTLASAVAGRARRDRRGATLGFQQSAGGLARVVGPLLGGALFQHVGIASPYVVGAGLAVVALVFVPSRTPSEVERVPSNL
ncbi:MAG: transporter, family, tetracycline resistance protein [Acidimicrobiaceae bacterium]